VSPPPQLKTLEITSDGDVGTLTLNRPDAMNAMDPELIFELTVAAAWLADRAPFRALIVTGAGRAFSAGGDVNWFMKGLEDPEHDLPADVRRGAEVLHQAIVDFRRIPYPVIGAVNGAAAGAGGRIGASPDGGMTYFLPRVVGPAKALELALNDPVIDAKSALELGIVSEVVPPDKLLEAANAKASELAVKAPHYVRMAKRLIGESLEHSLTEHLQLERHGIADSMATEDLRRGVTAFKAGETPEFQGD
jgi:2-(1,2-epoxy-1,2-dihydrophenyl)acetyl-CoA isomerase